MALQEVCFGERVRVAATLRLCERNSRLNAKLLRATAAQPGLAWLTICDMLPQDLDADLVRAVHALRCSADSPLWGPRCPVPGEHAHLMAVRGAASLRCAENPRILEACAST